MRSRRSAWRRTTSTSGRASPTWSVPSRSLSRPTPRSPRRSSTTSPSTATFAGDFRRTDELYAEATRLGERYGDASSVRFVRGNRIWLDFMLGRWDRALESADTFIAECEAGSPHTLEYMRARSTFGTLARPRGSGRCTSRPAPVVRARADEARAIPQARLARSHRGAATPSSVRSTKRTHSLCRCRRSFARSGCTAR